MTEALKQISEELAATIAERFQSEEVQKLVEETKAATDAGTFEVVITTENLDRYQEVIKLDGWDIEHYRKNPIVLWGHDHDQPIGIATSIDIVDGKMIAKGKFAPTEKAQEIRQLYDAGIIKATSVGFIEKEREGNLITKAELLEFSFVSVPANPYALRLSMERGLFFDDLIKKGILFVEKEVDEQPEPEPEPEPEPQPEEKTYSTKQLSTVIQSLKDAVVALEALETKEPEGDDVSEQDTDEEKRTLEEFNARRKLLQEAATVLGDVLAEARKAIEARK